MYSLMKRLVWLAVFSCLIPRTSANSDCEVATAASSGTCAAVGTAASIASISLCAVTLGIGCAVAAGVVAVSSACGIIAGNIDCATGVDPGNPALFAKLNEITDYLNDIQDTVDKVNRKIDIGFFEAKYNEYINKIRAATKRYELDVIKKSKQSNGLIKNNALVREWVDDALGDGDYNVRGALDIIESMITGTQGITQTPSVYELAMKNNLCTTDLNEFVTSLLLEGTTLAFIALTMRGDGVHQADKDQLTKRLKMNQDAFISGCSHYVASNSELKYNGIWGSWGSMELCPGGGYATSFSQRVEAYQGENDGEDDTALNSICLQCNTGGEVCSRKGYWGSWATSPTCTQGYIGSDFSFEGEQGAEDDTAANNLELVCGDGDKQFTGNGRGWGNWLGYQYCPSGEVICGLKTRVEPRLGTERDDTALNGVHLQCCRNIWS